MTTRFGVLVALLAAFLAAFLAPLGASASSLFLDGAGSAVLTTGDILDQVIVTDSAFIDVQGGSILQDLTLLDVATGEVSGGLLGGPIEAFNEAVVTLLADPSVEWEVDGSAVPFGTVLDSTSCPSCSIVGTLSSGEALNITGSALQSGTIVLNASTSPPPPPVPEPSTMTMMGLGLLGLAVTGRRRSLSRPR